MQDHPMRERIYLPVVRFGVPHTDWKYVFFVTFAGLVLPFVLGVKLYGVPVPMFTGAVALALSVAFFNFIRLGRRPLWFQHTLRARFSGAARRAALPGDGLEEAWVKADGQAGGAQGRRSGDETHANAATVFRFEHL
jgi:hypothetical protein